ncbi:hypothetical protein AYO27_13255 [Rhizobium sp. GHKF11]|nr:hypothetical protein AYO27_13255 [Rhizobium sp. GHKF11]
MPFCFERMKNARQWKVPVDQHEILHVEGSNRHLVGDRQGGEKKIMPKLLFLLLWVRHVQMPQWTDGRHFSVETGSFGGEFSKSEVDGKDVFDPVVEALRFLWIISSGQVGTPP